MTVNEDLFFSFEFLDPLAKAFLKLVRKPERQKKNKNIQWTLKSIRSDGKILTSYIYTKNKRKNIDSNLYF